jgi:uncharacterized membrane protein
MYKQERIVSVELKKRLILSLGLVPHNLSSLVDYPLSIHSKPESTLIFLKFLLHNINLEISSIKKLNFLSNINSKIDLSSTEQKFSIFKNSHKVFHNYKALNYGQNIFKMKKKHVFWTTALGRPLYRK